MLRLKMLRKNYLLKVLGVLFKILINNNNKFNLLPVLIPLIGLYRLIPFIEKTLI